VELPIDGLIHISSLPYDRYDYDQSRLALVGRRGDNLFQLGQRLIVAVASVDLDRRQVDLRFVKRLADGDPLPKRRTGGKRRRREKEGSAKRAAPSKGKRKRRK
jgi:ribonuclease R